MTNTVTACNTVNLLDKTTYDQQVRPDTELWAVDEESDSDYKKMVVGWGMPSETYENIALGPNGINQVQHYTAPADGYAFVNSSYYGQSNAFIRMTIRPSGNQSDSNYYAVEHCFYNSWGTASLVLPVKKGADVELFYTTTWGADSFFKFIYAEGEV